MISITTGEINAWIVSFVFPLTRILALLAAAPPFNNTALPTRVRLIMGVALAVVLTPVIKDIPSLDPASGRGLLILAEQLLIGFAMGFALRLIFSAIDMAGSMISSQMGLGFATSYDPLSTSQTPVVSEAIGFLALLIFMAIDGHLMVLATLAESFRTLPIGELPGRGSWLNLANAGGTIFSAGLLLALPVVVALMIANIALGILGRVSPQLNLMAIGFPITISIGFGALYVSLTHMSLPLQQMFTTGLQSMLGLFVGR